MAYYFAILVGTFCICAIVRDMEDVMTLFTTTADPVHAESEYDLLLERANAEPDSLLARHMYIRTESDLDFRYGIFRAMERAGLL